MISFISIIKANKPLYIQCFTDGNNLKYNYLTHMALDILTTSARSGLLFIQDNTYIYSYTSSDNTHFVIGLDSDFDIDPLFRLVYKVYTKVLLNPLGEFDLNRLDQGIKLVVHPYNESIDHDIGISD